MFNTIPYSSIIALPWQAGKSGEPAYSAGFRSISMPNMEASLSVSISLDWAGGASRASGSMLRRVKSSFGSESMRQPAA